jgi:hypothetical protein
MASIRIDGYRLWLKMKANVCPSIDFFTGAAEGLRKREKA